MELKRKSPYRLAAPIGAFNRTIWNWNWVKYEGGYSLKTFNRTIWNWNGLQGNLESSIDTFNRTIWNWNESYHWQYTKGEAFNRTIWNWNKDFAPRPNWKERLLIELYGIETSVRPACPLPRATFNRTIWNWNDLRSRPSPAPPRSF